MAHSQITALAHERTAPFFAAASSRVPVHSGSLRWSATAAAGSLYKIETNVADAANSNLGTTEVQVEVSGPALLGQSWLRLTLAEPEGTPGVSGETYVPYVGMHVIKQLEVLVDGERVGPVMRDYPSSLKAFLRYQEPDQVETYLQAMGGSAELANSSTVMVPLLAPWGSTTGYHAGEQQFLPLHKIKGRREVVWRIVFASTGDLTGTNGALPAGNLISGCSVVSMAAYVQETALAADKSSIAILSRCFASLPVQDTSATTIGDAGADTLTIDIRSLQGAIESLHVFSRAGGASLVGSAVYSDSDLHVTELELNGSTHWRTSRGAEAGADAREHQLEQAIMGFGTSDATAGTLGSESYPIIPFCLYPRSDAFSGALPLGSGVSTLNITFGTQAGNIDSVAVVGIEVGCLTLDSAGRIRWRKAL